MSSLMLGPHHALALSGFSGNVDAVRAETPLTLATFHQLALSYAICLKSLSQIGMLICVTQLVL